MLRRLLFCTLLLAASAAPLAACDLCALYTAFAAREFRAGWSVGLFEQYSDFATVQDGGREVEDPAGQWVHSSVTQLFVGYQFSRRFGIQATLPWADRSFRRREGEEIERGSETGMGDVALLAHWQPFERVRGTSTLRFTLMGGVKLPTGDTDRLAEELAEGHGSGAGVGRLAAPFAHQDEGAGGEGAVHGHDLTLGTGSTDFVAGATLAATVGRAFIEANGQYAIRRTGEFDYRFANDLQATLAGGAFVLLRHEHSLALGAQLAAERKGRDRLHGETMGDTGVESLFAGPLARYTRGDRWFAELALDLPLSIDNTAVQIVPDWRARLGITHRF